MLILDRQGRPIFRKLFSGSKPEECIGALTQSGTPLIGLRTKDGAWLLALTEVGDAQIDRLPPKIRLLHRETPQSQSLDLSFGISEAQGLFVGLLSKTVATSIQDENTSPEPTFTIRQYSIQGQELQTSAINDIPVGTAADLLWFDNPHTSLHTRTRNCSFGVQQV